MTFSSSLTLIEGELVGGRPVVELELLSIGTLHVVPCIIDTGCDETLVFSDYADATAIGLRFNIAPRITRVVRLLSNGTRAYFVEGLATINWFGQHSVLVLAPDPLAPRDELQDDERRAMPRALIGQPLLAGCRMTIEFPPLSGRVIIEGPTSLVRDTVV